MDFEYFYNREVERFNFLKVPEILVDGEEFKGLSTEAIILYSMLLNEQIKENDLQKLKIFTSEVKKMNFRKLKILTVRL